MASEQETTSRATSRATSCKAALNDDVMVCGRCGLEWSAGAEAPACDPITFKHLRERMAGEVTRAEASLLAVIGLGRSGLPTDAAPARRRLAELEAVLRLVDRCAGDKALKDRLSTQDLSGACMDPAGGTTGKTMRRRSS